MLKSVATSVKLYGTGLAQRLFTAVLPSNQCISWLAWRWYSSSQSVPSSTSLHSTQTTDRNAQTEGKAEPGAAVGLPVSSRFPMALLQQAAMATNQQRARRRPMVNQKAEDHVQGVQKLSSGSSLGTSSKQTAAAVHEAAQHSHAVSGQSRQGAMPSSPNVHAQDVNAREAVSLPVVQATGQLRDREHASTSAASSFKDGASHTSEGSAAGCSSKPERNNLDLNFILQGGTHPDVPLWMQPDSVAFMHGEVILTSLPPTILESRKTRKALASAQGQLGAEMDQALQYAGGRGDSYRLHTHDTRSHSNFQQQGADLSSEHAGSAPQAMGRHEGDARWPSEAQAQQPVDSSHVLSAAQHARLQSDHLLRLIQNVRPYKVYTHQACRAVAKAAGKLSLAISSLEINPRGTGTHLKAALPIADRVFTELVNSKAHAPDKEVFAEEYGSAVHAMLVSVRLALSGFTSFTKVAHLQLPAAETAELLQTHIALVQLRARVDDEWAATVAALCKPARAGRLGVMHGMLSPEDARLKASTDLLAKCLKFELLSGPSTALPQAALLNHLCQQARQELHLAQSIHVESSSRPRIHFDDDQQAAGLTQQVRSVLDACLGCASGLLLQPRADRAALLNNAVQLSERLGGISAQARARCLHSLHAMAQQIAGSQQQKGSTQQGHSSALVRAANALWDVAAAVQTLGAYDSLLYSTAAEASMQMLRSFHKKATSCATCQRVAVRALNETLAGRHVDAALTAAAAQALLRGAASPRPEQAAAVQHIAQHAAQRLAWASVSNRELHQLARTLPDLRELYAGFPPDPHIPALLTGPETATFAYESTGVMGFGAWQGLVQDVESEEFTSLGEQCAQLLALQLQQVALERLAAGVSTGTAGNCLSASSSGSSTDTSSNSLNNGSSSGIGRGLGSSSSKVGSSSSSSSSSLPSTAPPSHPRGSYTEAAKAAQLLQVACAAHRVLQPQPAPPAALMNHLKSLHEHLQRQVQEEIEMVGDYSMSHAALPKPDGLLPEARPQWKAEMADARTALYTKAGPHAEALMELAEVGASLAPCVSQLLGGSEAGLLRLTLLQGLASWHEVETWRPLEQQQQQRPSVSHALGQAVKPCSLSNQASRSTGGSGSQPKGGPGMGGPGLGQQRAAAAPQMVPAVAVAAQVAEPGEPVNTLETAQDRPMGHAGSQPVTDRPKGCSGSQPATKLPVLVVHARAMHLAEQLIATTSNDAPCSELDPEMTHGSASGASVFGGDTAAAAAAGANLPGADVLDSTAMMASGWQATAERLGPTGSAKVLQALRRLSNPPVSDPPQLRWLAPSSLAPGAQYNHPRLQPANAAGHMKKKKDTHKGECSGKVALGWLVEVPQSHHALHRLHVPASLMAALLRTALPPLKGSVTLPLASSIDSSSQVSQASIVSSAGQLSSFDHLPLTASVLPTPIGPSEVQRAPSTNDVPSSFNKGIATSSSSTNSSTRSIKQNSTNIPSSSSSSSSSHTTAKSPGPEAPDVDRSPGLQSNAFDATVAGMLCSIHGCPPGIQAQVANSLALAWAPNAVSAWERIRLLTAAMDIALSNTNLRMQGVGLPPVHVWPHVRRADRFLELKKKDIFAHQAYHGTMSDLALFCQSLDRVVRFAEGSLQRQSTHVQQQSQPAERDAADDEIQGNSVEEAELLGTALQQLFVAPDVQELNKAASRTYLRARAAMEDRLLHEPPALMTVHEAQATASQLAMSFALPVAGPRRHSPTQVAALALALLGPLPPQAVLEALAQAARNMPTTHCILNSTAQPAAHPAAHTTAQPAAQPPDACLSEEEAQQHVSEALWCLRTLNVTQARSYASGLDAVEHDSIRAWAEGAPVRTQNLALVRAVVSNPATTLQILQQPALHVLFRGYLQRAIAPGTDKGDQAPEGRGGARVGLDPLAYLVQAPTLLTSSELLPLVQVLLQHKERVPRAVADALAWRIGLSEPDAADVARAGSHPSGVAANAASSDVLDSQGKGVGQQGRRSSQSATSIPAESVLERCQAVLLADAHAHADGGCDRQPSQRPPASSYTQHQQQTGPLRQAGLLEQGVQEAQGLQLPEPQHLSQLASMPLSAALSTVAQHLPPAAPFDAASMRHELHALTLAAASGGAGAGAAGRAAAAAAELAGNVLFPPPLLELSKACMRVPIRQVGKRPSHLPLASSSSLSADIQGSSSSSSTSTSTSSSALAAHSAVDTAAAAVADTNAVAGSRAADAQAVTESAEMHLVRDHKQQLLLENGSVKELPALGWHSVLEGMVTHGLQQQGRYAAALAPAMADAVALAPAAGSGCGGVAVSVGAPAAAAPVGRTFAEAREAVKHEQQPSCSSQHRSAEQAASSATPGPIAKPHQPSSMAASASLFGAAGYGLHAYTPQQSMQVAAILAKRAFHNPLPPPAELQMQGRDGSGITGSGLSSAAAFTDTSLAAFNVTPALAGEPASAPLPEKELQLLSRTVATLIVRGHMHSAPCTTSDPWVSRADGTSIATSSGQGPPRQVPGRYSTADAVQQYKERIAQREQSRSIQFSVCMERLGEDAVLQVLRLQAHPQYGDLDALQYTLQYSIRPWRKSTSMQRHGVLQRRAVATTAAEKSMQGIDAEASAQLTTSLQLHALQEHLQYHIKLLHALLQPNGQLAAPAALTATASHPLGASPPSGQYASHTSPSGATYADAATAASVPQPCAGQPPFLGVARTLSALNVVSRRVVLSKLPAFEMLAEELQAGLSMLPSPLDKASTSLVLNLLQLTTDPRAMHRPPVVQELARHALSMLAHSPQSLHPSQARTVLAAVQRLSSSISRGVAGHGGSLAGAVHEMLEALLGIYDKQPVAAADLVLWQQLHALCVRLAYVSPALMRAMLKMHKMQPMVHQLNTAKAHATTLASLTAISRSVDACSGLAAASNLHLHNVASTRQSGTSATAAPSMPASPGVQRHVLGPATVDVSTLGGLPVLESLGRLAGQAQQFEMPAVLQALIDLPNQAALLGALSWAAVQPPAPAKSGAGGGSSTASSTTPVQGTEHGADADATATASADMTSTIRQAHGNALSALTLSLFGRLDELRPAECVVALLALSNHEVYRTQCSRVTLSTGTGNTANNTALLLPGQQLDHDVVPQLEALYKRLKDQLPLDRSPGHAGMQGPLSIRTAPDTVTPMQQQGDALFGLGSDGGAAASASRRASSQPKTPAGEGSMHQAHMQCGGLATAGSPRAATASFTPGSADFITVMPVLPLPSTAALLLAAPRLAYMDRAVVSMLARFAAAQLDTCTSVDALWSTFAHLHFYCSQGPLESSHPHTADSANASAIAAGNIKQAQLQQRLESPHLPSKHLQQISMRNSQLLPAQTLIALLHATARLLQQPFPFAAALCHGLTTAQGVTARQQHLYRLLQALRTLHALQASVLQPNLWCTVLEAAVLHVLHGRLLESTVTSSLFAGEGKQWDPALGNATMPMGFGGLAAAARYDNGAQVEAECVAAGSAAAGAAAGYSVFGTAAGSVMDNVGGNVSDVDGMLTNSGEASRADGSSALPCADLSSPAFRVQGKPQSVAAAGSKPHSSGAAVAGAEDINREGPGTGVGAGPSGAEDSVRSDQAVLTQGLDTSGAELDNDLDWEPVRQPHHAGMYASRMIMHPVAHGLKWLLDELHVAGLYCDPLLEVLESHLTDMLTSGSPSSTMEDAPSMERMLDMVELHAREDAVHAVTSDLTTEMHAGSAAEADVHTVGAGAATTGTGSVTDRSAV